MSMRRPVCSIRVSLILVTGLGGRQGKGIRGGVGEAWLPGSTTYGGSITDVYNGCGAGVGGEFKDYYYCNCNCDQQKPTRGIRADVQHIYNIYIFMQILIKSVK